MPHLLRALSPVLLSISIFLVGCATPSLKIELGASENLNSDSAGESYAVLVRFYQLSDPVLFEKASVSSLLRDDVSLLSATLVKKQELMVSPGMVSRLEIPKQNSSEYIGVVAFYRDVASDNQKVLRKVNSGRVPFSTRLSLDLQANVVTLNYR